MRCWAVVIGVILAAMCSGGCSRKAPSRTIEQPSAMKPAQPAVDDRAVFTATAKLIQSAYAENELAADAKYKGKRGLIEVPEVLEIGRVRGVAVVEANGFGLFPPPATFFHFRAGQDEGLALLKKGDRGVKVLGTCRGKTQDFKDRRFQGYDFRVDYDDCVLVPVSSPDQAR